MTSTSSVLNHRFKIASKGWYRNLHIKCDHLNLITGLDKTKNDNGITSFLALNKTDEQI